VEKVFLVVSESVECSRLEKRQSNACKELEFCIVKWMYVDGREERQGVLFAEQGERQY